MKRDLQNSDLNSLLPDVQVDRRGFVAACIAAGFAVSAEPVLAQAIKTPMDGLDGGDVKIGEMPAYYAVPKAGGPRPVVLVAAEIWGLHEHIKDVTRRVAKEGYFAIANEPYYKIGELWKIEDIKQVIAGANQLPDDQMFKDLDATLAWAAKNQRAAADKVTQLRDAVEATMKAGVAWYGGLSPAQPAISQTPIDVVAKLRAPVLGLYGGADQGIPLDQVEKLRAALQSGDKAAKQSQIQVYEGMPHGFNADYRPSYRKEAADDGWKRMLAWFKQHAVA